MNKKIVYVFLLVCMFFTTGCDDDITKEYKEKGCLGLDTKYIVISGVDRKYYYTGSPITPKPIINAVNSKDAFREGIDYTINYVNNINVGTATIQVSGINLLCSGEIHYEIEYDPKNIKPIDNVSITGIKDVYAYTGSPITPEPIVKLNDVELTKDDYDVKYSDNIEAGLATIEVTGKGKYIGTRTIQFAILNSPVINCLNPSYNGEKQVIATCEGGIITNHEKETNVAKYKIDCVNKQNLNGRVMELTAVTECNIQPLDISSATVKDLGNSEIIKDRIRVEYNGKYLKYNVDYDIRSLSYFDHNKSYVRDITIIGKGNYTGTIKYDGEIALKTSISSAKIIRGKDQVYTGKKIVLTGDNAPKVNLNGEILKPGVDYEVEYKNNINPGAVKVIFTGIGDYTGTLEGIGFYIIGKKCGDNSQEAILDSDMIKEIKGNDGKFNSYIKEEKKSGKMVSHIYSELHVGESVTVEITIPAVCGEITGLHKVADNVKGPDNNWKAYFERTYKEYDTDGTSLRYDENGNVIFEMTIKAINGPSRNYKNAWYAFSPRRQYQVDSDKVKVKGINYSGLETTILSVKVLPEEVDLDPRIIEKNEEIADCCCLDSMSDKCYWSENGTCTDDGFGNTSHVASPDKCGKISYTCSMKYDEKNKKVTISGSVFADTSRSLRTISVKKTTIDGVETTSVKVKNTDNTKTYHGVVYFSNGQKAECTTTIKGTATPKTGRCCCIEGNYGCVWTTKDCKSINRYNNTAYNESTCKSNGAPQCGKKNGDSTTWSSAASRRICVTCETCVNDYVCKTFNASSSDIKTGTITVEGVNGVKINCPVNVYLRAKPVVSSKPTATPTPKATAKPLDPYITCKNPTYTGSLVLVATCSNGRFTLNDSTTLYKTLAGSYSLTCKGTNGVNTYATCYIKAKQTPTPTPVNCAAITNSGSCNSGQAATYCKWCTSNSKCVKKAATCPTPTPKPTPKPSCSSTNCGLCGTSSTCANAGCYWNNNTCSKATPKPTGKCCCTTNYGKDCAWQTTNVCNTAYPYSYLSSTTPANCNAR